MSELLEKAMSYRRPASAKAKKTTVEHESDLAIAWIKGEVSYAQVVAAIRLGDTRSGARGVYLWLAQSLRKAYQEGKLRVGE